MHRKEHQPHNPFREKTEPHIKHAKELAQTSLEALAVAIHLRQERH